jgi:tetratricopeptide (TPR) repeat protein
MSTRILFCFCITVSSVFAVAAFAQTPTVNTEPQALPVEPAPPPLDPVAEADNLMKLRGRANFDAALAKYEAALAKNPDDADLNWKTAEALCSIMRVQTDGGTLPLTGTADSSANKKIWKQLGPRAVLLAKKALDKSPNHEQYALTYAEAFMFESSSMGVITAILSNAKGTYFENFERLLRINKKADEGAGYIYKGSFYVVAPWPMSDDDEARTAFDLAISMDPRSVRNHYYRGMFAYRAGDWKATREHMTFVINNRCTLPSSVDICGFFKREAKKALDEAAKNP